MDDRIRWTGEWPGAAECREFGWYAKLVPNQGWIPCDKDDSEATEDLNRLRAKARWDRDNKRFVRSEAEGTPFDHVHFMLTDNLAVLMQVVGRDGEMEEACIGEAVCPLEELMECVGEALDELGAEGWSIEDGQRKTAERQLAAFWDMLLDFPSVVNCDDDDTYESLAMSEEEFWELIEATKETSGGDCNKQVESLTQKLSELSVEEIIAFDEILTETLDFIYLDDLWAVAAAIHNGHCSDDGFEYFRAWLVAQGKEMYGQAWLDPESLIGLVKPVAWCEPLLYVAKEAYALKTGTDIETVFENWPAVERGLSR